MLMAAIITFLNSSGHGIVTEQEESVGGSGGTAAIAVILRLLIQTVTGWMERIWIWTDRL